MKKIIITIMFLLLFIPNSIFSQLPPRLAVVGTPTVTISNNLAPILYNSAISIPQFEKFELNMIIDQKVSFGVNNRYTRPHDTDEIHLWAVFTNPFTQHTFKANLFYHETWIENTNSCVWETNKKPDKMFPTTNYYTPTGFAAPSQSWRLRCAFKDEGIYTYTIFATEFASGHTTPEILISGSVNVIANPSHKGFVKRKEGNDTYLFFTNGQLCFLNGVNEFMDESIYSYMCRMRSLIDEMKKNNINFMRVWINGHVKDWDYPSVMGSTIDIPTGKFPFSTAIYSQLASKIIDDLLEYARTKDMYIQLCLYNPPYGEGWDLYNPHNRKNSKHGINRFNSPNIGEIVNPWDFYNPNLLRETRNYIRYCAARWGYATNLVAWEIGNEINPSSALDSSNGKKFFHPDSGIAFRKNIILWHKKFKAMLNYYDAHKHLVTTSLLHAENFMGMKEFPLSNEQFAIFKDMDFSTSHNYYRSIECPKLPDEQEGDPNIECRKFEEHDQNIFHSNLIFKKNMTTVPTQIQEFGYNDDTCAENGHFDPFGVFVHNMIYSNVFSGTLGTPLSFNTYFHIQPKEHYHHYKALGAFMNQFEDLANPLYTIHQRTFNLNLAPCKPEVDFSEIGLKYYYMCNSEKQVIGWCQDKQFTISNLLWKNKQYLKSMDLRYKPSIINRPNKFSIRVPQAGFYKVSWYSTENIDNNVSQPVYIRSFKHNSNAKDSIIIVFPEALHNSKLGDGLFIAELECKTKIDFTLISPNNNEYNYSEPIILKVNNTQSIDEVEVIVDKVSSSGQFLSELFRKKILAKDFFKDKTFNLNDIYNSTNPSSKNIPPDQSQIAYYKVKINPSNPNNIANCSIEYNTTPIAFKIVSCGSIAKLKINDINSSSLSNPIEINFGEPILLDPSGSKGSTGHRIIVQEIDNSGNIIGNEINMWFGEALTQIKDLNKLIENHTTGIIKFLPTDVNSGYKLYKVYHVNFNSYTPYSGCSNWEYESQIIRIKCNSVINMQLIGGGNNTIKEYEYAEPILLDGTQSKGEIGYRVIIQPVDNNGYVNGSEINVLFNGQITELINLNTVVSNASGGTVRYLKPNANGPSYYKVSLVIFNSFNGGCESWLYESKTIKIKSCHVTIGFKLNNEEDGNTINTPYSFNYSNPLNLEPRSMKGFTGYRVILSKLNSSGTVLNEYNVLYQTNIFNNIELNNWLNTNYNIKKISAMDNNTQNIYALTIVAFNAYNDHGCDEWEYKKLYFKLNYQTNCGTKINDEDITGHTTSIKSIPYCTPTILKFLNTNQGTDSIRLTMMELEYATWLNPPRYITVYRPNSIKDQNTSKNPIDLKKDISEIFEKNISEIDLRNFWFRKRGYSVDPTKVYRVLAEAFSENETCKDSWSFSYYLCSVKPNNDINDQIQNRFQNASEKKKINANTTDITTFDSININNFIVYPNPANNIISIVFSKNICISQITIFDINGRQIMFKITNNYENNFDLNVSELLNGQYILKVLTTDGDYYIQKVIIQK